MLDRSSALTLGAYVLALGVVLGGGAVVGAALGPDRSGGDDHDVDGHGSCSDSTSTAGLAVSQGGYSLMLASHERPAGDGSDFEFVVTDPAGGPLEEFTLANERELHLVVVGRQLVEYAHLHPERDDAGVWSVPFPDLAPGSYRVFADFIPAGGDELTLGADLTVLGDVAAVELPAPVASTSVDGYDVAIDGTLTACTTSDLAVTITRDGDPVTGLQPYLGALGHLVAVREGDLAYTHVHPVTEMGDGSGGGPEIEFVAELPSAGTYRLFLEFDHDGAVHTAAFTMSVGTPAGTDAGVTGGHNENGAH